MNNIVINVSIKTPSTALMGPGGAAVRSEMAVRSPVTAYISFSVFSFKCVIVLPPNRLPARGNERGGMGGSFPFFFCEDTIPGGKSK